MRTKSRFSSQQLTEQNREPSVFIRLLINQEPVRDLTEVRFFFKWTKDMINEPKTKSDSSLAIS